MKFVRRTHTVQVLSDDIRERWSSRSDAMGLETPMELVAGNFFEDDLPKANAYVLRVRACDATDMMKVSCTILYTLGACVLAWAPRNEVLRSI